MAVMSPPATADSPREKLLNELLPSEVREPMSPAVRKYLRRETDIPAVDVRQNPTQGRIAGRIVRMTTN